MIHPQVLQSPEDTYIFSTIDHRQGLSNSAVICIFKDDSELMWFGTYDGVNCFDGREMEIFRADFSTSPTLDNNVIFSIDQADGNNLWISTMLGINRFSRKKKSVVANYSSPNGTCLSSNLRGDTWLVSRDSISYYNTFHHRFTGIYGPDIAIEDPDSRSFVTDDGTLWLFPDSGNTGLVYKLSLNAFDKKESDVRLNISSSRFHPKSIENIFYQSNVSFCFIDADDDLYMFDIGRQAKVRIRNIGSLLNKYGPVTDVMPFYDDFIIAFKTNGLIRLKMSELYAEEIIDQDLRVFYIYKDPVQMILWIGVDGKGAMMYAKRHSIATNIMMHNLSPNFSRQVRSIMTDRHGDLWVGTKGDGLIHVSDYAEGIDPADVSVYFPEKRQNAGNYTREDTEFPVFSLLQSNYMDGFWIGSGTAGLFYHTFGEDRIRNLATFAGQQYDEIHAIHEANDTTLYIASSGSGFRKLTLDRQGTAVSVKRQEQYHFFHGQQEIRTFFAMVPEGDSILWLGSRESGLIRFSTVTGEYSVISLSEKLNRTVDDVLSICRTGNGDMFVGTTAGLVSLRFGDEGVAGVRYTGREQGLLNDMIHGILEGSDGLLWLSTNKGLIKFNPETDSSHVYYYSSGVQIGEFSDDAYYKCPYTDRLFFGGIDGLLYIGKDTERGYDYYPEIVLRRMFFGRDEVNPADYCSQDGSAISFRHTKNSFTLSFIAPDYISGSDIGYSWMLENHDKNWTPFGAGNEATYNALPVGNYIFKVRYRKDIFGSDFQCLSIPVRVLPLWYQTPAALLLFSMAGISIALYFILMLKRFVRNKRLINILLESENKNMSNKSVFSDHDVVERMTSIYYACDQLRAENTTREQSGEIIESIREQVMSVLLPAGIFRKSEYPELTPLRFTIAGLMRIRNISDEVAAMLRARGTELGNIDVDIPETISFPVYKNAFRCLFCYIYMFAADAGRTAHFFVHSSSEGDTMTLTVASSAAILGQLHESLVSEEYRPDSHDPADDYGIRLMHRMVIILIHQSNAIVSYSDSGNEAELRLSFTPAVPVKTGTGKKTVLLLEDHEEMNWLISDILSGEYTVHIVSSIQHALDFIKQSHPVAFLVDMMMYADAEDTFTEFINRHGSLLSKTAFIPMLTWKTSSHMQRKLILQADSYLILPYDIIFLKEIIHKTIYGRKNGRQLYVEGLGDFANMVTCTTEAQVAFIRKMVSVIEENIDREDLGSTFIAQRMAMSPRQFYRKFKEISGQPPTELIKSYRMEKAAALLLNSDLSINDLISEIGISSRSYFYKEFTRKFGMTPKDYRDSHRIDAH